jgi:hypothetical protein
MKEVENTVALSQGQQQQMLLTNQCRSIEELVDKLCSESMLEIEGPLTSHEMPDDNDDRYIWKGRYACTCVAVEGYIKGRAPFVRQLYEGLDEETQDMLVTDVANLFLDTAVGFMKMREERDELNEAIEETQVPPVLPQDVAEMNSADFIFLLAKFENRIMAHYGEEEYENGLPAAFEEFKAACASEQHLRDALESNKITRPHRDFNVAWDQLGTARFQKLRCFFGPFAAIFPNTATVESDFSIVKFEKNAYRQSISDLSLGGVMHAKQFETLQDIPSS